MPNWISSIKDKLSRYIVISATSFNVDVRRVATDVRNGLARRWGAVRKAGLKAWVWLCGVARKVDETPVLVKIQLTLLTIILLFIFWQFMAYEMSQTTFISVNIIMAVCLTTATAVISVRAQRGVDEAHRLSAELKSDLAQRDAELDRLKTDLFELRNKNRRQNAIEKGSVRFVESVRMMKAKAQPDAGGLQYLIDAIDVCFDITGAVAFVRAASQEEQTGADEAATADEAPAEFTLAGRFGLSDEPPTKVFTEGDGILGQVVVSDKTLTLEKVPADYLTALSGLGRSRNINVYVLPLSAPDGKVMAVIEVASFEKLKIVDAWESIEAQLRDVI